MAVGLSADLLPGMAMPGHISGVALAIWRAASGHVHVWGDRCPHRGMRLSHGFVRGETLSCIYHGWKYGADGGCAYIPAHPNLEPPKSICATTYPCGDSCGVIWAALQDTADPLPALPGKIAVRSIAVAAPVAMITDRFGSRDPTVFNIGGPHDLTLALQQAGPNDCVVHALADAAADRKAVSRWLEAERREIEGIPK